ncbi:MAG TPA: hypothetical protein VEF76_13160 [Patescibacteria group bacterium]|nr:hypothetical protein [Patescibacteria group bacterium]
MDMKKIESFETTADAKYAARAISARYEGGQQFQTPAPFLRQAPAVSLAGAASA